MKDEQKRLKIKLTIIYWVNMLVLIALALVLVYKVGITGKSETEQNFMWERFSIILTLAVIPLSLKLFYSRQKQLIYLDLSEYLQRLGKLFIFRMMVLDLVIILNFIGFYTISALNFIYMAAIAIFVFVVCYPTETMVDPQEKKTHINKNNDTEL